MFCALLGHTGERLQDYWSSGFIFRFTGNFCKQACREGGIKIKIKYPKWFSR